MSARFARRLATMSGRCDVLRSSRMSLPPAATPDSTKSRWYVVALVVGVAMAALPPTLGTFLTSAGNAVGACNNEMGCEWLYIVGLYATPFAFIGSVVASGIKARRLALENASRARIWKEGFRVGCVALLPAGFFTFLALASFC
jgi:hypothetical protein